MDFAKNMRRNMKRRMKVKPKGMSGSAGAKKSLKLKGFGGLKFSGKKGY